jgi:hypothetical protein
VANYLCPRCGFETSRDGWWDRHPAAAVCAAVFGGLPALYTLAGIILAYPWFFIPVLIVVCAVVVDRRMRRRAAIAARADHEHREMMSQAIFAGRNIVPPQIQLPSPRFGPRHVMTRWPTTPMQTRPLRQPERNHR